MKIIIILLVLAAVNVAAVECSTGTMKYQDVCVAELVPESAPAVKPSDEKPPKDKMPSYEREGVKAATPPSLAVQDSNQDQQRIEADHAGKKAAGL